MVYLSCAQLQTALRQESSLFLLMQGRWAQSVVRYDVTFPTPQSAERPTDP